jgi:hypothetical protein
MRRAALLVVACLALAGCTAVPSGSTPTQTPTDTRSPEPARSPTPTPSEARVVAFADLPADSRAAFETSRRPNGLAVFVPDSPYIEGETFPPDAAEPFAEHEYVRADGTLFRIQLTEGRLYASYLVEARPATPEADATVVDYADVTESRQHAVRAAVENGSYTAELGQWSSAGLDAEYVRYENETYRIRIAVGDYWTRELRVEPV